MKVVIYTRVSTKEQVEGYSLTYQENICREYANKQGWEVVGVFQEQGESAKSANRTQLLKLLEFCNKHRKETDVVLVHKIDRVSRIAADYLAIKTTLIAHNIILRSVTEPIDDTSQGNFMGTIYAAVAQLDNDIRAERTKEGLKERVNQGLWAWGAPLGYKNTKAGLVIDKQTAPYIKKAFEVYAQGGHRLKDIASKLNSWGVRTKNGNRISTQAVANMLQNKLYIGRLTVKDWGVDIDGLHSKLISPELFYKVQQIREGVSFTAVPRLLNNPDFPLKNIAKCEHCGKGLTASRSRGRNKRYAYYHCLCGKTRVSKELFEQVFFDALKRIQPNKQFQRLFQEVLYDVWKQKQSEAIDSVKRIDGNIAVLKELQTKLVRKNLEGIISDDDYREQNQAIKEELVIKEVERSEARTEETDIDYLVAFSESLFNNVASIWLEATFGHKQMFQALLFPKGIVYKDGLIGTEQLGLPFALIQKSLDQKSTLVPRTGFEPVIYRLRTCRPGPLDERGADLILSAWP